MTKGRDVELDVREDLKNKLEPFQKIMSAVNTLELHDRLILHAPFKPKPLLTLLKAKGFTHEVEQRNKDHWVTVFTKKPKKNFLLALFTGDEKETNTATKASTIEVDDLEIAESVKKDLKKEGRIYTLDNRGLEPPKPMMRTLHQLTKMQDGEVLVIMNERVPIFLFEELESLGYEFHHEQTDEQTVEITITKS